MLAKAVITIGIKLSHVLLGLLTSIVLTRFFGVENFGFYVFVMALAQIGGFVVKLGFPGLLIRNIARYRSENDLNHAKGLFIRAFQIVGISSAFVIILFGINYFIHHDSRSAVYLAAAAMVSLEGLLAIAGALLMSYGRVITSQCILQIVRPVLFLVMMFSLWSAQTTGGVEIGFYAHVVSCVIAGLLLVWIVYRQIPHEFFLTKSSFRSRQWLTSGLHFALMGGVWMLFGQTDIIMLGIVGSHEDAGIYRISAFAASLVFFVSHGINDLYRPQIATLHSIEARPDLQRVVHYNSKLVFFLSTGVAIPLVLIAAPAVDWVYGPLFSGAVQPMVILCLGYALLGLAGPLTILLPMLGNERLALKTQLVALLINIGLNYILIPNYGPTGAAIATIISFFSWYAIQFILIKKYKKIRSFVI